MTNNNATEFTIDYTYENEVMVSEKRKHTTGVNPSESMVKNALHSICLDNGVRDFPKAEAIVYRNGVKVASYKLNARKF